MFFSEYVSVFDLIAHTLQKVFRILSGAQPRNSCSSLFKQLDILHVPCRNILSLVNFIFNNQDIFQQIHLHTILIQGISIIFILALQYASLIGVFLCSVLYTHLRTEILCLIHSKCMYVYIGFKTFFYAVRHLDSTASYLPTGLYLGSFRAWPFLFLPSSFSSVILVFSLVLASTSMLFENSCVNLKYRHSNRSNAPESL